MLLCEHCIAAIQSRGERIFVGPMLLDETQCEWCEEFSEDVHECMFD